MSSAKSELFGGVFYTSVTKYSGIIVNLVTTAILARLLVPEDFGIVAIATVIINFFSMLSDMGIGPAVIQNKSLDKNDISNIFSLTLYVGIILTIIFYLSSSLLSDFYNSPKLNNIISFFSLAIFFHCVDIVPNNLLKKDKRFRFIAIRTVLVQILCCVLSVIAAFCGFGIYSLLIQPILSSIALFVIDYREYPIRVLFRISLFSIKKIFAYSSYQFMFSFINYFSRNLDKLVVGRVFGTVELGYYEKSYRLMMLPVGNLSHVITPAIQPVFSEYQNDKEWLFSKSMRLFKLLTMIGFPLSALLYFASEEIVILLFGDQWYGAVPVFRIFSISVGLQIIYSPQGAFFQSANAVKEMFYCGIITAILNVLAVIIGCYLFKNLESLAWCINLAYFLAFFQVYYIMMKKVFVQPFCKFVLMLRDPIILSLLLCVILFLANTYFVFDSLVLSLFAKFMVFTIVIVVYEYLTSTYRLLIRK